MEKNQGSTLVEALISVGIVGIGALGLVSLQSNLIHAKAQANQHNEAMLVAQTKLDELRNYSTLAAYNALGSGNDNYAGANTIYTRTWTVTNFTSPDYKTVALEISWIKSDGQQGSIQLTSRIAKLNPVLSGKAMESLAPQNQLTPN